MTKEAKLSLPNENRSIVTGFKLSCLVTARLPQALQPSCDSIPEPTAMPGHAEPVATHTITLPQLSKRCTHKGHDVPSGCLISSGQLALVPLHLSNGSHGPLLGLHVT